MLWAVKERSWLVYSISRWKKGLCRGVDRVEQDDYNGSPARLAVESLLGIVIDNQARRIISKREI